MLGAHGFIKGWKYGIARNLHSIIQPAEAVKNCWPQKIRRAVNMERSTKFTNWFLIKRSVPRCRVNVNGLSAVTWPRWVRSEEFLAPFGLFGVTRITLVGFCYWLLDRSQELDSFFLSTLYGWAATPPPKKKNLSWRKQKRWLKTFPICFFLVLAFVSLVPVLWISYCSSILTFCVSYYGP